MADKLAALAGPGEGPKVFVGDKSEVTLEVTGLKGGCVDVEVLNGDMRVMQSVDCDGLHSVPNGQWVTVSHEGDCEELICSVVSR